MYGAMHSLPCLSDTRSNQIMMMMMDGILAFDVDMHEAMNRMIDYSSWMIIIDLENEIPLGWYS